MKKREQPGLRPPFSFSHDEGLNNLLDSVVQDVKSYAHRLHCQIRKLADIGRALSGVYDLNILLEMIVDQARGFTNADAGTLYIKEGDHLRFMIVQNDSLNIRMGGKTGDTIPFSPVELKESNVSGFVALNGISVNIPDVYDTALFDFTGPKNFDRATGYRTKSMLVVLMRNHENDVIGILQLLNAKNPETGEVIAFSPDCENLTECLASQAAMAVSNVTLVNDMENLFEAFVKVMATAIDEKSPITGGHIRRVANLTLTMAEVINRKNEGFFKDVNFDADAMHELRIAAWMHDIGKVTTPVEIIEKSQKLQTIFNRIHHVELRMDYLLEKVRSKGLEKRVELMEKDASREELLQAEKETQREIEEISGIRQFILKCNNHEERLADADIERLHCIGRRTYVDGDGRTQVYLTDDEIENLSIRKGTITETERQIMKDHAYVTLKMLQAIPFTKKLKDIPHFAAAHHECLDGSGYPLGLKGDEIPFEGKLMAVTDIAEALTASDRPYKKAMSLDEVYCILRGMAKKNKLDPDIVELFIEDRVYEVYKQKYEPESYMREKIVQRYPDSKDQDIQSPPPEEPTRLVNEISGASKKMV